MATIRLALLCSYVQGREMCPGTRFPGLLPSTPDYPRSGFDEGSGRCGRFRPPTSRRTFFDGRSLGRTYCSSNDCAPFSRYWLMALPPPCSDTQNLICVSKAHIGADPTICPSTTSAKCGAGAHIVSLNHLRRAFAGPSSTSTRMCEASSRPKTYELLPVRTVNGPSKGAFSTTSMVASGISPRAPK